MPKLDNETILLAIAVVAGLALLMQAIILLAIFITMRKSIKSLREETEDLRSSVTPFLYDARELLANTQAILTNAQEFLANAQGFFTRMVPKVEAATVDAVEITHKLRAQTEEIQSSATEILERVRRQSDRLDDMLTRFLDTVDRAGGFVVQVVSRPVQQVSHVLGAAKAVFESLRASRRQRGPVPPSDGGNRFV